MSEQEQNRYILGVSNKEWNSGFFTGYPSGLATGLFLGMLVLQVWGGPAEGLSVTRETDNNIQMDILVNRGKNPADQNIITLYRVASDGTRMLRVAALNDYWGEVALELIESKCDEVEDISMENQENRGYERFLVVKDSSCIREK